jgi:hypothetical protein
MTRRTTTNRKWHSSEIDMVRHLVEVQDQSYQQVAAHFRVNKNSIMGICHRYAIKHGDSYVRIHKPVTKRPIKPFIKGELIDKKCAYCGEKFKAAEKDIKRFCSTKHAYDFHNREHRLDRNLAPSGSKKAWLNPPADSKRCICNAVAVPNHSFCYSHA